MDRLEELLNEASSLVKPRWAISGQVELFRYHNSTWLAVVGPFKGKGDTALIAAEQLLTNIKEGVKK